MCSSSPYYRSLPIEARMRPALDRMEERRARLEAETRALIRKNAIGTVMLLAFACTILYGIAELLGLA